MKQVNCGVKTCPNYGRYNRYCGHGEAVIEKPARPAKVAEKRDKINKKEYYPEAKKFVKEHPECELKMMGCTGKTQCVHHTKGKSSIALLLDKRFWKGACFWCNNAVEVKDGEARSKDLKLSKFNEHTTNQ
jgi:hypothetical protein